MSLVDVECLTQHVHDCKNWGSKRDRVVVLVIFFIMYPFTKIFANQEYVLYDIGDDPKKWCNSRCQISGMVAFKVKIELLIHVHNISSKHNILHLLINYLHIFNIYINIEFHLIFIQLPHHFSNLYMLLRCSNSFRAIKDNYHFFSIIDQEKN